jgi:hypothetical protein
MSRETGCNFHTCEGCPQEHDWGCRDTRRRSINKPKDKQRRIATMRMKNTRWYNGKYYQDAGI